jgi:hypothetical protein
METLSYDMLDHLCCSVEYKMESGENFDKAYLTTKNEFCHEGYDEIQEETKFLLTVNSKKMKILKNSIGLFGLVAFLTGSIGGRFHMIGSGILTVLGCLLMVIYLLTQFKTKYLEEPTKQVKIIKNTSLLTGVLLILGLCFVMMRWPGAKIMFGSGLLLLMLVIAPLLFKNFQGIVKQINGAVAAISVAFIGMIMFAFSNVGNSTDFYRNIAAGDDIISEKYEQLTVSNALSSNIKHQDILNKIEDTIDYISKIKQSCITATLKEEIYPQEFKNARYLINNDIYTVDYQNLAENQNFKFTPGELYSKIKMLQDVLAANKIQDYPIVSSSQEEWKGDYFDSKMLLGMFLYLDQLQLEIRRIEREVLLYHL